MLVTFYVALLVALPVALSLVVAFKGLARSRLCPLCAGETLRLQSRWHALVSRLVPASEIHARWCPSCDWAGTARVPALLPSTAARNRPSPTGEGAGSRGPGLEVRRLEMEDGAWRVRLECWAEAGTWHGRLLFVGPAGDAWVDGRRLLTGPSAVDVLSQALSLSDRALVGRIRKATR